MRGGRLGALGLRGGGEVRGRDPITEPRLASVSRNDTNSSEKLWGEKMRLEKGSTKRVGVRQAQ